LFWLSYDSLKVMGFRQFWWGLGWSTSWAGRPVGNTSTAARLATQQFDTDARYCGRAATVITGKPHGAVAIDQKGIRQLIEGIGWATILVGIYGSEHNLCVPFRNIYIELGLQSMEGRTT
jgi:hypothetical protein